MTITAERRVAPAPPPAASSGFDQQLNLVLVGHLVLAALCSAAFVGAANPSGFALSVL